MVFDFVIVGYEPDAPFSCVIVGETVAMISVVGYVIFTVGVTPGVMFDAVTL